MNLLFAVILATCDVGMVDHFDISAPHAQRIAALPISLEVTAKDAEGNTATAFCGTAPITGLTDRSGIQIVETPAFSGGVVRLDQVVPAAEVRVGSGAQAGTFRVADLPSIPGFLSLFPALLAIGLAVWLRQALLALFAGVWVGALFLHGYNPFTALLRTFDTYLPQTVVDSGHAATIFFTMALGGMVGIIAKSGGTKALVDAIAKRATSRRAGMVTGWASGLVVFFDDYANCLLVGNTVRPFTDRLHISREKLSYIVDSTAAPVATVALVSTWIGYQVGLLDETLGGGRYGDAGSGYDLFLGLLPYSFYSFFTIGFVLMVALSLRDFGPMAKAEARAQATGEVLRPGAQPLMDRELTDMVPTSHAHPHWITAVVPIASVIAIVFGGLYFSGRQALGADANGASLRAIIGSADSYAVLLWASFGGSLIAFGIAKLRGDVTVGEAVEAWVAGAKSMVMAVLILVLAWALGSICKDHLLTGPWLLSQVDPSPHWIPVITFLLSGMIAFATGSSFSTMAIVIPIAAPLAWHLTGPGTGIEGELMESIRYATLAAVLSGAVFGDHCSPISDTTIMSSMASASDHVDHVRTQTPYALLCAAVAAGAGFIPAGFGVSPLITLPVGMGILAAVLYVFGRRTEPNRAA